MRKNYLLCEDKLNRQWQHANSMKKESEMYVETVEEIVCPAKDWNWKDWIFCWCLPVVDPEWFRWVSGNPSNFLRKCTCTIHIGFCFYYHFSRWLCQQTKWAWRIYVCCEPSCANLKTSASCVKPTESHQNFILLA